MHRGQWTYHGVQRHIENLNDPLLAKASWSSRLCHCAPRILTSPKVDCSARVQDWGDLVDFVHFGEVGSHMVDNCQYYILVCPQNIVGSTILTNLNEMVSTTNLRLSCLSAYSSSWCMAF